MKILLDLSPAGIQDRADRFNTEFWQLRTPLTNYRLSGMPYAVDNGCYTVFHRSRWLKLLDDAKADVDYKPLFVTLPDIVGDARRTVELFMDVDNQGVTAGLPRALVLQDGIGDVDIPWQRLKAVFIGGSDAFKISPEAINAARAAKMMGKWVHVGRVNTPLRVENWLGLADSIDGSGISRYDHMLERILKTISGEDQQHKFDLTEEWDAEAVAKWTMDNLRKQI